MTGESSLGTASQIRPRRRGPACPGVRHAAFLTAPEVLDWQERYIQTMLAAVRAADWDDPQAAQVSVIATMQTWLPSDQLAFLMELSVQPLAERLGVAA